MSLAGDDYVENWAADRDEKASAMAERVEEGEISAELAPVGVPELESDDAHLWEVTTDEVANWALRKIAQASKELERLQALADHEIEGIQQWLDHASVSPVRTSTFFTAKLIEYRRRLEDDNPDLPLTYKLPGGDLTRRAGRSKMIVTDEEVFVTWAAMHAPGVLSMKPLVSKMTPKRYSTTESGELVDLFTGEIVPGVAVSAGSPSYGVKVR